MAAPYKVSMDPEQARRLATTGVSLLLLDVPQGTLLGVDQQVFVVGPRFKGLKMVPPGVHFLSYQATGRGNMAPAVSTFLVLNSREVVVRRWDAAQEGLAPFTDEDEAGRYAEGVRRFDFDSGLAPYDLAACATWHDLSCFIDEPLLQRLMPPGGEISVMGEALDPDLMHPRTEAERRLVAQLQEGHARQQLRRAEMVAATAMDTEEGASGAAGSSGEGPGTGAATSAAPAPAGGGSETRWGRCSYTQLPRMVKPECASGAALTALNMDKTAVLEAAAAAAGDPGGKALLGELQFAFIAFMFGQSLEGFLQWKTLTGLFLSCERGPLQSRTGLFVAFLATVQQQLAIGLGQRQAEGDVRRRQGRPGPGGDDTGSSDDDDEEANGGDEGGPCPLGLPLVEELLPDSFLRRQFGGFFEMLHDAGPQVPLVLAKQAGLLEVLLRDRLGWDYRVHQLGAGGQDGDSDEVAEDEDQPVVVELSAEERRMAGLEI